MAKETVKDRCSFCGRSEREVGFPLLTGYTGCICVDCAEQASIAAREIKQKVSDLQFGLDELPKPKEIKAFYMKMNDDGKTVRAMDVLFPRIGEIIGGSQREENYDKLLARIEELHIPMKDMWWYLDTRRFGTAPHSGFGLGFERLLLFVTGMTNIRDVIPFPRTPKNAEF